MKPPRRSRLFRLRLLPLVLGATMAAATSNGTAQSNSKAATFYEDALVRYEKRDIPGAIIQLKNALQIDPAMLPVQLLLGKALMLNGEVAAAEVAYLEALKLGVNRAEVVLPLGRAYVAQGKHKLVLEEKTFILDGLPPSTQLQMHLLRASIFADLGDSQRALRAIDEARAIDNRSAQVWLSEVPIRIRAGQLKEATLAADRALALAPDLAEVWYHKGSILHVQGELRGALSAYDRVLQADPSLVEARVSRVGIYMDSSRFADAAKDVAELRRISPNEPRGAYLKALLAERDGDTVATNAALKEVTDLLDPVPINFVRYRPQLLMLNGLAHFGLNQREKAKQYLEAFQRVQNNTPASKLLARLYQSEGNAAQAANLLETYLKAQPGDGQAMILLATAYMGMGRHSKATSLMQEAIKAKDNPGYRTALGLSFVGGGQPTDATREFETAFKNDPGQTQAAISLIQLYLSSNQASKAVPVAEALVKRESANPGFHNLLGMAYGQVGNIPGSRAAFEKAIKISPTLTIAKVNLARVEIATKSYDAAATRLLELVKIDDKNCEAMEQLSIIADIKGQPVEAQRWLEKARDAAGPKDLRWGKALVEFHLKYGRASQALAAAKVASNKAPEDLPTLVALSRAQIAIGDTIGAKSTLGNATRFAEYNPGLQVEIASLQMAANNPAGAAYCLDKALASNPGFLPAQALMAEVEIRQKEFAKAEKRAKDIAAQYPKLAVGHSLGGDVAMARSQPAAAVDAYRRAHQIQPSTTTVMRLFQALAAQDNGKPALVFAEQWLQTHPRDTVVRKALANGYARNGNWLPAKAAYEAVLKAKPDDPEALNNMANVQVRLKDPGAIKTAELAMVKAPGNAFVTDTLGWALFQNGQYDRALQMLRDARLRQPDSPEIRYHLAAALEKTGRNNEAREELEAAFKVGRPFEGSADATKLLKSLK